MSVATEPTYSTAEVAERTGLTTRQLNYYASRNFVFPGQKAPGTGKYLRWRDVDIAAARAVGQIISDDPTGLTVPLAMAVVDGIYRWWGKAPWIVVSTGEGAIPAYDTADAVNTAGRMSPVATIVALDGDAPHG